MFFLFSSLSLSLSLSFSLYIIYDLSVGNAKVTGQINNSADNAVFFESLIRNDGTGHFIKSLIRDQ